MDAASGVGGGKTMRLRRYTRWTGDRVACGDYMLFLFCHPGVLAPAALHTADKPSRGAACSARTSLRASPARHKNNAPAALHKAGANTMAPTRGAYMLFISHNPPSAPPTVIEDDAIVVNPTKSGTRLVGQSSERTLSCSSKHVAPQAPNPPAWQNKKNM